MASSEPYYTVNLTDNDVPGAKLIYSEIERHSKLQLQRFLSCRNLKVRGNKSELVTRAKEAIDKGIKIWKNIDNGKWATLKEKEFRSGRLSQRPNRPPNFPIIWNKFPTSPIPKMFCYGKLFHYLVNSCVVSEHYNINEESDSDKENDDSNNNCATSKPLTRGQQYFDSGHVSELEDAMCQGHYCVKSNVRASYKNSSYLVMVMLNSDGDVVDAHCICKASGMGRCSHVAAVLIALDDFVSKFSSDVACTSKVCTWNTGRRQGKNPGKVNKNYRSKLDHTKKISFDPRYISNSSIEEKKERVAKFAASLSQNRISCWEVLLQPPHNNYKLDPDRKNILRILVDQLKDNLIYGIQEPTCITNSQNDDEKWHRFRKILITASRIKEYHCEKTTNEQYFNLVERHFYKSGVINSPYLQYGIENEPKAFEDYLKLKIEEVGEAFTATATGLWINPLYAGIGASPDALVFDPSESPPEGLLEIKCSKLLQHTIPTDLSKLTSAQKSSFSCALDGGTLKLKSKHKYFAQIQTQMGITNRLWCDFVVWTPLGISIQRIRFSESAFQDLMFKASSFFNNLLGPEYFEQRVPRKLCPFNLNE